MTITKRDEYLIAALIVVSIIAYSLYKSSMSSQEVLAGAGSESPSSGPDYEDSGLTVDAVAFLGGALG
jgi:hypothetical protein